MAPIGGLRALCVGLGLPDVQAVGALSLERVALALVMGGGVVGVWETVGVDVDERCDRKGEAMVESVFDVVGRVVACLDG